MNPVFGTLTGQPRRIGDCDRRRQSEFGFGVCQSGRRHTWRQSVLAVRRAGERRRQYHGDVVYDAGYGDALGSGPVHGAC